MKFLLFIWAFLCSSFFTNAQDTEFSSVDNKMLYIPTAQASSTDSIGAFIHSNFTTERQKFRAIYRWVTYNIKYDSDSMYVFNWSEDPQRKVTDALRRKKGVCENYAAIFNEIALKCGLQCHVVSGYTKQLGVIDKAGHSWCAVNANGEWLLCDPTWDEAYTNNPNSFLIDPALFIETHMPFDPLWQLLERPFTAMEFYKGNFHSRREKINYADSVSDFIKMNELQQLESSAARIKKAGVANELTRIQVAYIEMQAAIIKETKDRNGYNSAVDDLNNAKKIFNDFVQYRNNQFIPEIPDSKMEQLLSPVDSILLSAIIKLDLSDRSTSNGQYDTGNLRAEINNLKGKVSQQNDFLKKYLSAELLERKKLFYAN